MSDAHDQHQSIIKTPKQFIAVVAAGFLVPIVVIFLLTVYVAQNKKIGVGSDGQSPAAVAARIKPVADDGFVLKDAASPKQLQAAADVYKAACAACHDTGAAGAPKTGDAPAWSARINQGYDSLVSNAIKGIRGMPPKGGNPNLDDVEVARAVVFIANQSGAKFKEPEANTLAAAAPAAAPATGTTTAVAAPALTPSPAAAANNPAPAVAPTPAPAKITADAGKKLYEANCQACHAAGVAGAPKLGDKAAWTARIAQGNAVLYEHAIKGFQGKAGFMPPKGGASAPDDEVKAAVDYMTAASK